MLQASEYSALSPLTSLKSVDKESERVGWVFKACLMQRKSVTMMYVMSYQTHMLYANV